MQAPASLSAEARDSFAHAVATISALGDDPQHSAAAIERFAVASERAAAIRQAWEDAGRPMLRTGTGPARAHPLVKAMQDAETHAAAFGDALLLSPAARAKAGRAGWRKGSARAEDRQPRGLRVAQ